MKQRLYLILLVTLTLSSIACSPKPDIQGFSDEKWKKDYFGCQGLRQKELTALLESKKQLQGVSERSLIKLLGKPDKTAFYERNIRNFIYYTEPGGQCEGIEGKAGHRIIVELNALGNVTWINEEII